MKLEVFGMGVKKAVHFQLFYAAVLSILNKFHCSITPETIAKMIKCHALLQDPTILSTQERRHRV